MESVARTLSSHFYWRRIRYEKRYALGGAGKWRVVRVLILELQGQLQSGIYPRHDVRRDASNSVGEIAAVQSHDLRDVCDGVLRKTALPCSQQNVTRRIEESGVRSEHNDEDRPNSAPVKGFGLDDKYRSPKTGP
jgi:hypothetical protein